MSEDQDQGGQQPVDDDGSVRFRPPITSTTHILPFERLSPLDFERLCLWLVEREGYTHAEHLGLAGSEQGRDVIAYKPTSQGEELWYFQCKRYRSIRAKTLKDEVDKYLKLAQEKPHLKPFGVVFVVSCAVSADARAEVGAYCEQHNLASEFWALTELDLCVKRHPDLLSEFFDLYTRPIHIPLQAPPLPPYFVPRPDMSDAVKARLLDEEAAAPGTLVVSAVHGLGGIGKTTLVAHLAYDPDIQERFPDGILWATLGQEPDVLSLLAGWIQALGDYDFHPTTIGMATPHLRTLLHDKACLLVIDDAWQADHTRAFLMGGKRCRVLVTTREATLARKVGARLYDLDVMTEAQALALFEARLGPLNGDREQAEALAHELGYLPLALELAAAQVEGGVTWEELLEAFRQGLTDLAALDLDEATFRNESLRLSFRLSLERLLPADQEAFAWLGVLPEDARLNPAMAAALWDQPQIDARKRLYRLRDKALVKTVSDNSYILHDLLHDEAKHWLAERMSLAEAHDALLARFQRKVPNARWDCLPDDGYIHTHLTWHMEQAGQIEAIHALLRLETPEAHNAWYQVCETLGQTAGFLDDVRRAWRLAEHSLPISGEGRGEGAKGWSEGIGLQCRYALIITSFNSLAENVPPTLSIALVENELWSPAQGLAYAQQVLDQESKAEALVGLASHLSEPLLKEALATARGIESEPARAWALTALASHLPNGLRERTLREALAVTQEIRPNRERARALAGLAPYLSVELREQELWEMLAATQEIWAGDSLAWVFQEFDRADALTVLAPHLSEPLLREALATAREIEHEQARAQTLANLAPCLPTRLLSEVLAAVQGIENGKWQADAMKGLIPYLPAELREQTLRKALAAARQLPEEDEDLAVANNPREEALAGLLPLLAELGHLEEALVAARGIEQETARAEALAAMVPQLAALGSPEEALAVTREIEWGVSQAEALVALAPHLSERLLREALTLAQEIWWDEYRAKALVGLAPHVSEPLLLGTLAAVQEIEDKWLKAKSLVGLAPHLSEELRKRTLREALSVANRIDDSDELAKTMGSLAPYLPEKMSEPALREALAAARSVRRADHQASALAEIAPHFPECLLKETLTAVREITNDGSGARAEALAGLAPYLSEQLLREALAMVPGIGLEDWQVRALTALLPRLVELGRSQEALAVAREVKGVAGRARVLSSLASRLSGALREQALQEGLTAAREVKDADDRTQALSDLAPHFPESLREQVLQEALATARGIEFESKRAWALTVLAPHLSERLLRDALAMAQGFELGQYRVLTLASLIPRLAELGYPEEAVVEAQEIPWNEVRVKTLTAMLPYLSLQLREQLLQETLLVAQEIADAKTLTELAVHLPAGLREQTLQDALVTACKIRFAESREKALEALIPPLSAFPRAGLARLWLETWDDSSIFSTLACRSRHDLLSDIRVLAPVIHKLGEQEAIAETIRAIQDVGRWWP